MLPHSVVLAAFVALVSQGNIVQALSTDPDFDTKSEYIDSVYRRDISTGEVATVQENTDLSKRVTEATTIGLGVLGAVAGSTGIISTAYAIVLYNRPESKAKRIASKYVGASSQSSLISRC